MSWASYLFNGINEKDSPVTSLAPGTDEEIAVRIDASATPLSRTRILSDLIRSLKVFITRPEFPFLTGPYWRASLCFLRIVIRSPSFLLVKLDATITGRVSCSPR